MNYYYRLWCPDCLNEDYEGCFEGGVERDDVPYPTPQEANKAGFEETRDFIWMWEVVDETGNVIEVPWD